MPNLPDANIYVKRLMFIEPSMGFYHPIMYASDFWILRKEFIQLTNETQKNETTIRFKAGTLPVKYLGYQMQFLMTMEQHKEWGVASEADYDEYKRIYLETNFYLFWVTAIVTVLHTVFEFLAFRSDIQFWNGK